MDWRRCFVCVAAFLCVWASFQAVAWAEQSSSQWLGVSSTGLWLSADPDEPSLRIGLQGKRRYAMAGGEMVVFGRRSTPLDFAVTFAGFVALVNFDGHQPMPWQSFRGNMGINTIWRSRWIDERIMPRGGTLMLELGYFHESDHAVDLRAFEHIYMGRTDTGFDNGNFSAYEYVRIRLRYQQSWMDERLRLLVMIGCRPFTPSINPGDQRQLETAVSAEARLSVRIVRGLFAAAGVFYEAIFNDFVAADHGFSPEFGLDHDVLQFLVAELAMGWRSQGGHVMALTGSYSRSHGRGLDFAELTSSFGFGLRAQF